MKAIFAATLAAAFLATPAIAENNESDSAAIGASAPLGTALLPADRPIRVRLDEELSSRHHEEGDRFSMTVVEDVTVDGAVVIPKGAHAVGEVTWKTGKGMFGKSGKMEIEARYVEVAGRRIPLDGTVREEGEGKKKEAIWGIVLVGPFAAVITGENAVLPEDHEFVVRTEQATPVVLHAGLPSPMPIAAALLAAH